MSEKKSFWSTLPGVLVGTATVISSILGVFTVFNDQDSNNDGNTSQSEPSASASSGSGTDFPEASLNPDSLSFGKQRLGDSAPQTISVINSGKSDLEFGNVQLTGGGKKTTFKVVQDTCGAEAIPPDSRCQIQVVFSPDRVGSFSATLELEHNAQDTPSEIPLSGEGVLLGL